MSIQSYKRVIAEHVTEELAPACTGNPRDCLLCTVIGHIFEGFPTEVNPGCEIGEKQVPERRR